LAVVPEIKKMGLTQAILQVRQQIFFGDLMVINLDRYRNSDQYLMDIIQTIFIISIFWETVILKTLVFTIVA
jgi:hypothetical protein